MELSVMAMGLEQARDAIKNVQKQATYAGMLTLNNVSKQIQAQEIETAQKVFTIRKPWFKPKTATGFNIQFAKKTDLKAVVYSRAPFLKNQEFGGTKTANLGKYPLEIPSSAIQQKTGGRLVPARYSLTKLKTDPKRAKAFQTKNGNWFRRVNKNTIAPLFFKETSAHIKGRFPFTELGMDIVEKNYANEYSKNFDYAMKTAN